MKNKIVILVAGSLAVIALFGGRTIKSHLSTIRKEITTSVRDSTPSEYEVERIKRLIAGMSEDVLVFEDKITDIESRAAAQRDELTKLEQQLEMDCKDLMTERNFLVRNADSFQIRGVTYTRAQVEASAQARMAQINRNEATAETKRKVIDGLEMAVRDGRSRLDEAIEARDNQIHELELLSARLANAELQKDIQALAAPLRDGALMRTHSELADSMKAFGDRVRSAEREVESSSLTTSAPSLIPHESPETEPSLIEQMDQFLTSAPSTPVNDTE